MDSDCGMIRGQFLTASERQHLLSLVRRPSGQHGPARRAHAILLLDDGLSVPEVARVLYVDDDTVYQWHQRWTSGGVGRLTDFGWKGSLPRLSAPQEIDLVKALMARVFISTSEIIALVEKRFSIAYSRSGMIKLLARLGFEYKKPKALPRLPTVQAQQAFVAEYSRLLSRLGANDQVVFLDAVHPEYQSRPAHGWIKKGDPVAILRTAGRQRLNLHGAINLESGLCQIVEGETVNAETTIRLFSRLLSAYPGAGKIHVFLDNAKYHHAKEVEAWMVEHGQRLDLRFLPPYAPNLNAIERLWRVMHTSVTHNKYYERFADFVDAVNVFFRKTLPSQWLKLRDFISDDFHIIDPRNFRVLM